MIERHQRRQHDVQLAQRQHLAHIEARFENIEAIAHQRRFRRIAQEQQVARAERVQHRQVNPFAERPQLLDQRPGVEFTVKRQKYRDAVRRLNVRMRDEALGYLVCGKALLARRKLAPTLAYELTNGLALLRELGLKRHRIRLAQCGVQHINR